MRASRRAKIPADVSFTPTQGCWDLVILAGLVDLKLAPLSLTTENQKLD